MRATISVAGLWQYDNSVLDLLALPANMSREVVVNNILYETQELECAIPDPDRLKEAVGFWSAKQLPVWTKLQATLNLDYDPIANYDRTETETITHEETGSDTSSGGDTTNIYTAGFNDTASTAAVPSDKTVTQLGSIVDRERDFTDTRNMRARGNIGVTTTQEMIQQERDIVQFNMIDYIVNDFKNQFCLLVY